MENCIKWVYLSPHFDDVIYSCAGLICQQIKKGDQVKIITVFGEASLDEVVLSEYAVKLHKRWKLGQDSAITRKREDLDACSFLDCESFHLPFRDCIYRRLPDSDQVVVNSDFDLFHSDPLRENELIDEILDYLKSIPEDTQVISPLAMGNHLDHLITRLAAEKLDRSLYYYADLPYSAGRTLEEIESTVELNNKVFDIGTDCVDKWQQAVVLYASQFSTFWKNEKELRQELDGFLQKCSGFRLWYSPEQAGKIYCS